MDREELIMRYVGGDLSEEEIRLFEHKINNDKVLAKEVDEMMELQTFSEKRIRRKKSVDALEMAHNEFIKGLKIDELGDKSTRRKFSFWFLIIISSLLILGYFVRKTKMESPPNNNQVLFANYFNPEEASFQTKSTEETNDEIIIAQSLFNQQKYAESLIHFENHMNQNEESTEELFYYALALLGGDRTENAIPILEILRSENAIFKNECLWYMSLAFLEQGNSSEAISLLKKIDGSSSKSSLAQKLHDELTDN